MNLFKYSLLFVSIGLIFACSDGNDTSLRNDLIKKTTGPAIVGQNVDFAYAAGTTSGKLMTVEALAGIAGASGTGFDLYSYYTTNRPVTINGTYYAGGAEVPVRSVQETLTNGNLTTATMADKIDEVYMKPSVTYGTSQVDLIAATLRYSYVVPEEAKGKNVSFTFTAKSSTGETVSYKTPGYPVSKMDMKRLIPMASGDICYFSIEDMAAYTKDEVENRNLADKIDFIYIYQATFNTFTYGHAFVSPGTDTKYIASPNVLISSMKSKTKMEKRVDVRDAQLKGSIPNVYIDDIDFQTLQLDQAVDFVLTLVADEGVFMKTANGKYAAYVYVNTVNANGTVTVSMKRYLL